MTVEEQFRYYLWGLPPSFALFSFQKLSVDCAHGWGRWGAGWKRRRHSWFSVGHKTRNRWIHSKVLPSWEAQVGTHHLSTLWSSCTLQSVRTPPESACGVTGRACSRCCLPLIIISAVGTGGRFSSTFSILPFSFWNLSGGSACSCPSSPYFIALIASEMVLRAASRTFSNCCCVQISMTKVRFWNFSFLFFFFLWCVGFNSTQREQGKHLNFHRNHQVCIYRAITWKNHFTQLKEMEKHPRTRSIYFPSAAHDYPAVEFLTCPCCCPSRNLPQLLFVWFSCC